MSDFQPATFSTAAGWALAPRGSRRKGLPGVHVAVTAADYRHQSATCCFGGNGKRVIRIINNFFPFFFGGILRCFFFEKNSYYLYFSFCNSIFFKIHFVIFQVPILVWGVVCYLLCRIFFALLSTSVEALTLGDSYQLEEKSALSFHGLSRLCF